MSDTPRTNEHSLNMETEDFDVELAKTYAFARQLERELTSAKNTLTQLYLLTDPYADGAPDATSHDKLCNEISSICKPFITIL